MKVMVTGGAGYLGAVLVPMLVEEGHDVVVYDKLNFGVHSVLNFAGSDQVTFVRADVRDIDALHRAAEGCDAFIHLAAIVGVPACAAEPTLTETTNLTGTRNMIKVAGRRPLVFASTGSTYGAVNGICTEETHINPLSSYGRTKAEGERMCRDQGAVALRFATVFGVAPRMRLDLLVNDFVYKAIHEKVIVLYEGHFRRTFLHVKDAARALLFAFNNHQIMQGEAYNIGDESMNYTKRDIAKLVQKKIDYNLYEADIGQDLDQRDYEVSYEKVRKLGYNVQTDMDKGIDELIKVIPLFREHSDFRNI